MFTAVCKNSPSKNCSKTLLVTLTMEGVNKELLAYCILDEHSNVSLVDDKVFAFFGQEFPKQDYSMKFATQGCEFSNSGYLVSGLQVRGLMEEETISIPSALSCPDIADTRDEVATPEVVSSHPRIAHFANKFPEFHPDVEVLLLIGRNVGRAMATECLSDEEPYVHKTPLGFSLVDSPCLKRTQTIPNSPTVFRTAVPLVHSDIRLFFPQKPTLQTDAFHQSSDDDTPGLSQDDRKFLDILSTGITITEEGSIELPLPLKSCDLPSNRIPVLMRTKTTLARLKGQPTKLQSCIESMEKNLKCGYIESVPPEQISSPSWCLPIFAVTHPKKKKVRMVFDASARFSGMSLNDELFQGPDLNNQLRLRGVLLRFRERPIAFGGDIQDMFNTFKVPVNQRNYLQFNWFEENNPDRPLCLFRSTSHVFGCNSSPAVASFGMKFCASSSLLDSSDCAKDYLFHSFYVDDGLASVDTPEQAIEILGKAREVLSSFNIRLHKLMSNSPQVLACFPATEIARENNPLPMEPNGQQAALGISWNSTEDVLEIKSELFSRPFTQRGILSVTNSLYDPIGMICPVTLTGRLLQREVLTPQKNHNDLSSYGWDDELPSCYKPQWETWLSSLKDIHMLHLPHSLLPGNFSPEKQELHVFSDASNLAIGYVAYLKSFSADGRSCMRFVTALSRVTPRSANTIPRLELCAAVEASTCVSNLMRELKHKPSSVFMYTDSQIVLGYLRNQQRCFSKSVERRVEMILTSTRLEDWHFISTSDNPADIATRSHTVRELLSSKWFSGPESVSSSVEEHVSTKNHNVLISDCNIISRINNVHTRKLVESFLIKNTENMNSYEVSVKIDNVTSELLKKNVKSLNALLNKLENG